MYILLRILLKSYYALVFQVLRNGYPYEKTDSAEDVASKYVAWEVHSQIQSTEADAPYE